MNDNQFNESIKIIEYFQHTDLKTESLIYPNPSLKQKQDKELLLNFWNELESWLKAYNDISEKHKALHNHVKKIRDNIFKIHSDENVVKNINNNDSTIFSNKIENNSILR